MQGQPLSVPLTTGALAQESARALYHRLVVGDCAVAPPEHGSQHDAGPDARPDPAPGVAPLWDALLTLQEDHEGAEIPEGVGAERVLLGYAPTALLAGCWLAGAVHVRCSHSALGAAILDAHFFLCGEGCSAMHHGNLYRALLAARGLVLPEPTSPGILSDPRLHEADFQLALTGQRLGLDEDAAQQPALLGFHAAATVLGPPPAVIRAAAAGPQDRFFAAHTAGSAESRRAHQLARCCLEAYAAQGGTDWAGVWSGVTTFVHAQRTWHAALRPTPQRSPWQAMIELVEAKARHGFGFHRGVLVRGRALDDWLHPQRVDARALLVEFARSRWVQPGRPDDSPLIARTVQFSGPMFGVFTEAEITTLREWISALPDQPQPPPPPPDRQPGPAPAAPPPALPAMSRPRASTPPARWPTLPQLYHHFLCQGREPTTSALAREHTLRLLRKARGAATIERLKAQGLWPPSPQQLAAWVDARLHDQVFEGPEDADPQELGLLQDLTHKDAVFLLTQLAPAALVDGAWLQGAAAPDLSHTQVAALLQRIYRDELGAGVAHQHHGNVMRSALAAQEVALPPCDSPELSTWPGLLPEAFSTPVLWLAIALHSAEFLPELLGLNLAIEMAGIGRTYGRAIALLRHHRIDPYFFELHNTIDNGASGHTAWSVQAIELYLDQPSLRGDTAALERAWLRLWQGHAAYAASSAPLLRAVALRLGPGLGWRWLRRQVRGLLPGGRS